MPGNTLIRGSVLSFLRHFLDVRLPKCDILKHRVACELLSAVYLEGVSVHRGAGRALSRSPLPWWLLKQNFRCPRGPSSPSGAFCAGCCHQREGRETFCSAGTVLPARHFACQPDVLWSRLENGALIWENKNVKNSSAHLWVLYTMVTMANATDVSKPRSSPRKMEARNATIQIA